MKILRTYVLKECIVPFFLALSILTSVFLLGNLMQLAHMVINKGVSLAMVGQIFLLFIPVLLGYTLPIACIVSIILGFSRLSADNEILAMRASGIYLKSILNPLIILGIIFSLICFLLNDRLIPYAHHAQRQALQNLAKNPTALLEPGVFINSFDNNTLFIHKIEGNKLYNVTIYQPQGEGKRSRTIIASRGEFSRVPGEEQVLLKLIKGSSDEPDEKNPSHFYKLNFETFYITLNLSKERTAADKKPKSMTLQELYARIIEYEKIFANIAPLTTEFYRRISWSFSPLVFILLGFPLAVITHKRQKSANVVIAMFAVAIYYLLSLGCEALGRQGILPPALITWGPNVIGGALALYFNYKVCKS